jgi:bla regulator protein blaR1
VNSPPVRAQAKTDGSASLRFEVVSIKSAKPDPLNLGFRMVSGGSIIASSTTLKQLIAFTYDVRESQISGGPSWISSEKYDILAQPVPPEVPADVREMSEDQRIRALDRTHERLRSLLAERFQLTVRRDTRQLPAYALLIGKNGSKLQEFKEGAHNLQGIGLGKGQLTLRRSTMQMLATVLSQLVGGPVQDQTGLTGTFDGKLEWTPEPGEPSLVPEATPTPNLSGRPPLFTALQEQLGLKLESTGGPVEVIVVDKVEKPSEN